MGDNGHKFPCLLGLGLGVAGPSLAPAANLLHQIIGTGRADGILVLKLPAFHTSDIIDLFQIKKLQSSNKLDKSFKTPNE